MLRITAREIPGLLSATVAAAIATGATAQEPGRAAGEEAFSCAFISAAEPAQAEQMLYFIAGYEAGRKAGSANDSGEQNTAEQPEGEAAAELSPDPRMTQVVATSSTDFFEIPVDEVNAACTENPSRSVPEVLEELRAAGAGASSEDG